MPASPFRKIVLLTLLTFGTSALLFLSGFLGPFELKAYDHMSRHLNPRKVSDRIVIVAIDQESISALADQDISWPWPRQVYAPLLEYLSEADAVFMDILFTEDSSYGMDDDKVFAEAIRKNGNVYLPVFLTDTKDELGRAEDELVQRISIQGLGAAAVSYRSLIAPLWQFGTAAAGLGNVMIKPDSDGIYRRVPLVFRTAGHEIPNFVLSCLINKKQVVVRDHALFAGGKKIPLADGALLLRYSAHPAAFRTVSASEVIRSRLASSAGKEPSLKKESFRGKNVFIALTAPGLYDLKPTAVTPVSTGVHIHATTLENLLGQTYLTPVKTPFTVLFMLAVSVLVTAAVFRHHSLHISAAVFLGTALAALAIPALLFITGLYMQVIPPLITAVLSFAGASAYSYAVEGRQRRFIKRTFDQYMDKTLVEHVLKHPEVVRPGGQKKRVTVFFADIAGFTTLAEQLPPEESAMILHGIFNAFTEVIIRNKGVIDKYIGDCVMAFWGAPVSSARDEISACRAALECMDALRELNASFAEQGLAPVSMRIGIHTGDAIAGNLGSDRLFDYTVVGDTVNLASRLESVNKVFGTKVIISGETFAGTEDLFLSRELGRIEVKGKSSAVTIFEIVSTRDTAPADSWEKLTLFHEGLELFRKREWQQAAETFARVLSRWPEDGPSAFYLHRCSSPPGTASLTGRSDIITMTEK
ncbi:MAG: adenylate/guanylate cyclase domain-containing protein [Nitrospirae bacterium]|nr:adenylate/guanylate cyclase domain-containing protein [Nitrospirota bacterium]